MMINEFSRLAEYNKLMNYRMYDAASRLTDKQLNDDKGAFFKSVLGTLNHIIVGDIIWLKRFSTHASGKEQLAYISNLAVPESLDAIIYADFNCLRAEREKVDDIILAWCDVLKVTDLEQPLAYLNYKGEAHNKRLGDLVLHLFLHQTHHRGQVTTLLSQQGIDFGDTDLIEIIPDE